MTVVAHGIAVLVLAGGGVFAAGRDEAPAAAAGSAAAVSGGATDIVLVDGRFTWPQNWLDAPTAAQLGISQYQESPMLAELVASGQLPPVEERLPDDPLVIGPYERTGSYGGTLRVARMGPGDFGDMHRGEKAFLFRADPTTTRIIPYLAKGYEVSADRHVLTFFLREGARWSDGEPFTSADFTWLHEHAFADQEVRNSGRGSWVLGGELADFEAVDDYTVRITAAIPLSPLKVTTMLNWQQTRQSVTYAPAHYMRRYHKATNPDVEALAAEQGFESWVQMFNEHLNQNPRQRFEQPQMGAWIMESRDSTGKRDVRNPYFWAVDTAGNQLPYIDRQHVQYFTDAEVAILSMMQGSVDIGGRLLSAGDLPLYKQNESIGDYSVREWQEIKTARVIYAFNVTHQDPVKRTIFADKRFRQAMSLAINREEIKEFAFQGLASPQQYTADPTADFYDPTWAEAYSAYDPARAMALLEELGLRDRDGDGFREAPNGDRLTVDMAVGRFSALGTVGLTTSQLVLEHWQEVGIDVNYREIEFGFFHELRQANQLDVAVWIGERYLPTRLPSSMTFDARYSGYARGWLPWWNHQKWVIEGSKGQEPASGEAPPPEWQRYITNWQAWADAPTIEEFNRIGAELWAQQADMLPLIGTVGKPLAPAIINNRIRNVPQTLPFAFESLLWSQTTPAQWFIDES